MSGSQNWLLPEGIEEVLPPHAAQLEALCRAAADQFRSWGYELVMPPLIEFLETLLTGTGEDLGLRTFKLTDQVSGRLMGVRADMTPQMARIDAHLLKRDFPTRLCYLGTVLHTLPAGPGGTRAPLQVGAELYGHSGPESDAEILALMLKTLQLAGMHEVHVDLGHVGIFRHLVEDLGLESEQERALFDALQRKAAADVAARVRDWNLPRGPAALLTRLTELNGPMSGLDEARRALADAGAGVAACLDDLEKIAELVQRQVRDAPLFFDMAELRGYHYHTGMMFSTYVSGEGQAVANGGRYDDIGAAFGRKRPATGFSADLLSLFELARSGNGGRRAIYAPASELPGRQEMIDSLRAAGEIVVCELPGSTGTPASLDCDREMAVEKGRWIVKPLTGR